MRLDGRALAGTLVVGWAAAALAQPCEPGWHALGGVDGQITSMTLWDPDGSGPEPPVLVVAGSFSMAGGAPAYQLATWNPATGEWRPLGDGLGAPMGAPRGAVYAMETLRSGELVVAGYFERAGGVVVNGIASWDGSVWRSLGGGVSGPLWPAVGSAGVRSLETLPSGDLVAAGTFTHAGGIRVDGVGAWDGEGWRSLGGRIESGSVGSLVVHPEAGLLAASDQSILRLDGATWEPFTDPVHWGVTHLVSQVRSMVVTAEGDLVAAGAFRSAGGVAGTRRIARWDGMAWNSMEAGLDGGPFGFTLVNQVAQLPSGDLVVVGWFDTAGEISAANVVRWDGARWHALGSGLDYTAAAVVSMPNGDLVVGGDFQRAGGVLSPHLAIWRECPSCYADCDGDGELTFFDFLCFQNLFVAGDPGADCDGDGELTFFDFLCFQNEFAVGCG